MKIGLLILLIFVSATAATAQSTRRVVTVSGVNVRVVNGEGSLGQTLELDSKLLKRKVWFNVLLPEHYFDADSTGRKYPVLYLLHGLAGRYDNWSTKTGIADDIDGKPWIVVTPEGANGWYTDSATAADDKFESYILDEVIPEVDHRYRTIAERRARVIAGLSMGGYGAIKFGLKYPDMFTVVGSFSGALDAPLPTPKSAGLRPSIASVFGAEGSKTRSENDIFALVRNAPPEKLKTFPFIYLDCGTEDPFFPTNRDFDALLVEKKLPHEYRELPGNHGWDYWNQQIDEFLKVMVKHAP